MLKLKISNKLRPHMFYLAAFFLISIVPFYWLRGGLPVGFGDGGLNLFFNLTKQQIFSTYTWNSNVSTGIPTPNIQTSIPLFAWGRLLEFLGMSQAIIEASGFALIIFLSLLFSYLLILELFKEHQHRERIAFLSALFYTLNPFVIFYFWYSLRFSMWVLPFYPMVLFFLIKGYNTFNLLFAVLLGIFIAINPIAFINPAYVAPLAIPIILILIHYLIKNKQPRIKYLEYSFWTIIISLFLSSFWLIPFISSYNVQYSSAIDALDPLNTLKIISYEFINWASMMRLTPSEANGLWTWRYASWESIYYSPIFVLISYLFIIISLFPLLFKKDRQQEFVILFALIGLIGLFFSKGLQAPLAGLYSYLFLNIPFFNVFRDPLDKFGIIVIIGLVPLFGLGLNRLYLTIKSTTFSKLGVISMPSVFLISFALFGGYNFIFWAGQVVDTPTSYGNSTYVKIPDYYFQTNTVLADGDYRIASLPLKPLDHSSYDWDYGYAGADDSWLLYNKPVISYLNFGLDNAADALQKSIYSQNGIAKMAGILNIRYIIIQNDVDLEHGNYGGQTLMSPNTLKTIITANSFHYVKTIGKLDIYELADQNSVPHIYSAASAIIVDANKDNLANIASMADFDPNESIFILKNQLTHLQLVNPTSIENRPNIDFKKVNPTKYEVHVTNAAQPFFLVLSESYNPQWKAYINKQGKSTNWLETFYRSSIPDENHLEVNGYANAWYIDPSTIGPGGDFDITLDYMPQSYFYLGCVISGTTFIGCLAALVIVWRKRRQNSRSASIVRGESRWLP